MFDAGPSEVTLEEFAPTDQVGDEIYQSSGVRSLINCRGTITVIGEVEIRFGANHSTHTLYLRQQGNQVHGTHQGTLWPATCEVVRVA